MRGDPPPVDGQRGPVPIPSRAVPLARVTSCGGGDHAPGADGRASPPSGSGIRRTERQRLPQSVLPVFTVPMLAYRVKEQDGWAR